MLEKYLKQRIKEREILLMTHIVMGHPNFDESMRLVETMVEVGVDIMELQIPFSEPMADGPVILQANQVALSNGATVERCLRFAREVRERFDIPFLFMSYYNILFKHGLFAFTQTMQEIGIAGAIVPDLPPEEAAEYLTAMRERQLEPVMIFAPTTSEERMTRLAGVSGGLVYCVARKGVTGAKTSFGDELTAYLARCRRATDLPLALGFGVKDRADVDFLRGKVDIAVVGSQTIRVAAEHGVPGVREFLAGLR